MDGQREVLSILLCLFFLLLTVLLWRVNRLRGVSNYVDYDLAVIDLGESLTIAMIEDGEKKLMR